MSQYQHLSGYQLLLRRAQEHRDNPTSSEQRLLTALTQELPHFNFQFQVVMVPFIVDFVSVDKMVIIEVDGKSHEGNSDSDETRQRDLERDGYSFIRFTHEEVISATSQVVSAVQRFCVMPTSQRRRFASPKSEFVSRGMTPRVIGEQNPFAGLYTRRELEIILSEEDPYDFLESLESNETKGSSNLSATVCTSCSESISAHEPRVRDHSVESSVRWIHKNCRLMNRK
jgi:very-short-patch-repair endonuclease